MPKRCLGQGRTRQDDAHAIQPEVCLHRLAILPTPTYPHMYGTVR